MADNVPLHKQLAQTGTLPGGDPVIESCFTGPAKGEKARAELSDSQRKPPKPVSTNLKAY